MFNSWTFKADGALSERKRTFDPGTGKTVCPQACGHCRAKKLKCTGERSGCQRCKAMSKACVYTPSARGQHGANNRKADQPEQESMASEKKHYRKRSVASRSIKDKSSKMDSPPGDAVVNPVDSEQSHPQSISSTPTPQPTSSRPSTASPITSPSSPSSFSSAFSPVGGATPLPFSLESFFIGSDENYTTADMMMLSGNSDSIDIPELNPVGCVEPSPLTLLDMHSVPDDLDNDSSHLYFLQDPCVEDQKSFYTQLATEPGCGMVVDSSPASLFSSSADSTSTCECLQHVVLFMDEVEGLLGEESSNTIEEMPDLVLATHKEALRHMRAMMECVRCLESVENMTILTFLTAKLARLCRRVPHALSTGGSSGNVVRNTFAGNESNVSFWSYKVDSLDEYQVVMRGLLDHQVHELNHFIQQLVGAARRLDSDAMARRLVAAKRTLDAILPTSSSGFD